MQYRSERVLVETTRYRITGDLTLPRDGYRSRVSDFLNSSDRDFIPLTDVTIERLDSAGGADDLVHREFITIARNHIVIATTTESGEREPAASDAA